MVSLADLKPTQQAAVIAAASARIRTRRERDPWIGPAGSARLAQRPPEVPWSIWLINAGRGFGKTRTGAEMVRMMVMYQGRRHIALVAPTAADARQTMIEGESGLLAVCERAGFGAKFNPSTRTVTFQNGAKATYYSAEKPRQLRGPNHDGAWCDEIAVWKYAETFDMLQMTTRMKSVSGRVPIVVTSTPAPTALVRSLVKSALDPGTPHVVMTTGTSFENRANLEESWFTEHLRKYEGTRLGRQELHAELLEDYEGAFWHLAMFDRDRARLDQHGRPAVPGQKYICVSVDPATTFVTTATKKPDQTGIAVTGRGVDNHYYVWHAEGVTETPEAWAGRVCRLYEEFEANEIVYEGNQGGEIVGTMIRQWWNANRPGVVVPKVRRVTAKRAKSVRAEPIAMLYEQGRVHHVGTFRAAEDQMSAFPVDETANDDIVDAVVHGITACHKPGLAKVR